MVAPKQLFIITPCGFHMEWLATYQSIINSNIVNHWDITWILVHNHDSSHVDYNFRGKIKVRQLSLPNVSCVSTARNKALDLVGKSGEMVIFLDSGDQISPSIDFSFLRESKNCLYNFGCNIVTLEKVIPYKNRFPIKILGNPFYLGSVILSNELIGESRFIPGRKEDWKFWLQILAKDPCVVNVDQKLYSYFVRGKWNHGSRKSKLITDQFSFYHKFLNFSWPKSLVYTALHYMYLTASWIFR